MTYCSSMVSDPRLKEFTCPVDADKCPSGEDATLDITSINTTFTREQRWSAADFDVGANCKYNIKYSGELKNGRTHYYNLNIRIDKLENINIGSLIQIPFSGIFDNNATV